MKVVTRLADGAPVAEHRRLDCGGKTFVLWAPYTGVVRNPKMGALRLSTAEDFDTAHAEYRILPCGHKGNSAKWDRQHCPTCTRNTPIPDCKEGYSHSWVSGGGEGMFSVKCRTCGLLAMREHNGHVYKWRKLKTDPWVERKSKP